jgi:predicted MFS family arabinose efflux permease
LRTPRCEWNRWWIVFGSSLALTVCNGPILAFTFGVFLKPVAAEFGWTRGGVSLASGAAILMMAIAAPFTGMAVDRWGVRRFLLPVIVIASASVAAIALTPPSLPIFIAMYGLTGLTWAGQGPQPYVKTIAEWFDDRRGLAIGIAMAGVGLGIVLLPQLTRFLIDTHGWRQAYLGLGAVSFVVAFPSVALFVHDAPRAAAEHGAIRAPVPPRPISARFGLLLAVVFLAATAVNGSIAHLVPMLTDQGFSFALATSVLSVVGLASIIGRLSCGYLADRFFAPRVAAGFFLLSALGVFLLTLGSVWPSLAGGIALGLALGCEIDMMALLTTRYFGLLRFGELYGYLFAAFSAGSALGAYLMGVSYDYLHSYSVMLSSFILSLIAASLLILRLGHYVFPVGARSTVGGLGFAIFDRRV